MEQDKHKSETEIEKINLNQGLTCMTLDLGLSTRKSTVTLSEYLWKLKDANCKPHRAMDRPRKNKIVVCAAVTRKRISAWLKHTFFILSEKKTTTHHR